MPGIEHEAAVELLRPNPHLSASLIANDTLYGLGAGVWTRTCTRPTSSGAPSRPAGSGPTATTSTRPTRPLAATSSPASAGRTTRWCSTTTSRRRTCSWATRRASSGSSDRAVDSVSRVAVTGKAADLLRRLSSASSSAPGCWPTMSWASSGRAAP